MCQDDELDQEIIDSQKLAKATDEYLARFYPDYTLASYTFDAGRSISGCIKGRRPTITIVLSENEGK